MVRWRRARHAEPPAPPLESVRTAQQVLKDIAQSRFAPRTTTRRKTTEDKLLLAWPLAVRTMLLVRPVLLSLLLSLLRLLVAAKVRWVVRASCRRRWCLRRGPGRRPSRTLRGHERLLCKASCMWGLLGRGGLVVGGRLWVLILLALVLVPGLVVEVETTRGRLMVWNGDLRLSRRV